MRRSARCSCRGSELDAHALSEINRTRNHKGARFLKAVLRLFSVGFVAAGFQLAAVGLVTFVVFALVQHGLIGSPSSSTSSKLAAAQLKTQASVLIGAYLIIGFGAALTENRYLDSTSARIRELSRRLPIWSRAHSTQRWYG
jgi:hypothetical protein